MLIRRHIRKRLLQSHLVGRRLTSNHVQSHVNGSFTVALTRSAVLADETHLERHARYLLDALGYGNLLRVRAGSTNGGRVLYVTFTSPALVEEAVNRYGGSPLEALLPALIAQRDLAEAEAAGGEVTEEVRELAASVDALLEEEPEFDLLAVEVDMPELEASEV
jgi:hypothetical protein